MVLAHRAVTISARVGTGMVDAAAGAVGEDLTEHRCAAVDYVVDCAALRRQQTMSVLLFELITVSLEQLFE